MTLRNPCLHSLALVVFALAACEREAAVPPTPVVEPVAVPASTTGATTAYTCDSGQTVSVQYPAAETARVNYRSRAYDLRLAPSTTGARYVGAGVEFWTVARDGAEGATLSRLGPNQDVGVQVLERCSRPSAPSATPLPVPATAEPVASQPTSGPASNTPPCRGPQLKLSSEGGDAGAGNRVAIIGVQNLGTRACTLSGYPTVTLQDAQSRPLTDIRADQSPGNYFRTNGQPAAVTLAPQAKAFFDVAWNVVPNETIQQSCPTAARLRVIAPGDTAVVSLNQALTPCGGRIRVSAFRDVAEPAPEPVTPAAPTKR